MSARPIVIIMFFIYLKKLLLFSGNRCTDAQNELTFVRFCCICCLHISKYFSYYLFFGLPIIKKYNVIIIIFCNFSLLTFSIRSMVGCKSRPKSMNFHSIPSRWYSSCSRINIWKSNIIFLHLSVTFVKLSTPF